MHLRANRHRSPEPHRRPRRALGALLLAALLGIAGASPASAEPDRTPGSGTVVSFTFDDGSVSQTSGAEVLQRHGMRGTFYIISGAIGSPGYLGHDELRRIADAGHEIGGHTVTHPDLTSVSPDEMRRQICDDRANLEQWGYQATSFTTPFNETDQNVRKAVQDCGYNSARTMGGLRAPGDCADCPAAESTPPADPYEIRSPGMIRRETTVDDLKEAVTRADDAGGGWVPLVLHQTCEMCGPLGLNPRVLDEFAGWLHDRGTPVRTVHEIVGGRVAPVHRASPPQDRDRPVNASLEHAGPDGLPIGWETGGWGTNTPVWTRTRDAHEGRWAQRLDMTRFTDGDAKLMSTLDLGEYSLPAHTGHNYTLSTWYKSTAPTQLAVYYRDRVGQWRYWVAGPTFAPAEQWSRAHWTTPPVPEEATGLSYGLALFSPGSVTTDDYQVRVDAKATNESSCRELDWWVPRRWLCP
ncbi:MULTISPECIES: polysaccharide deacetylase family protein [unclassified Saccharopolyspora]|uniref:polysaccharide deacetylase family protein n=1 Tax=unclassified Saccharopolyspora TaxID=2646250 RepID=UPI001CD35E0F|nr:MULTISPECIES: polysaccharide deacetylase family protein [unclassified Saccharopolyspora]MCA1186053.1 polysaccharide deacetylase family protein [Saccharopolyspora sp. 6T]MCA1192452.1 polysaccharide deacetylase family protein [Saccharopolyspora sp. 6V]MCA1224508.1 polysaccharide deacetylase family protein [Saccharopolyspora sp. 6M]MCA1282248.1 polysaccharide deacetylase family protein [Saccharopolyspora sp. 7B]